MLTAALLVASKGNGVGFCMREIEPIVRRFRTNLPQRFEVARGRGLLQGVVVEIDETSGRALSIQRISEAVG